MTKAKRIAQEHNEMADKIFGDLAKTADLATVIAVAAHGADDFTDTSKCLGAIKTASEIIAERISDSLVKLETLKL